MTNPSFREILAQFLEEKDASLLRKTQPSELDSPSNLANNPAAQPSAVPEPNSWFTWQAPQVKSTNTKAYPRSAARQNSAAAAAPAEATASPIPAPEPSNLYPNETLIRATELKSGEQVQVEVMIGLGAAELNEGISQQRLKRAYRRLVKTLHPDRLDKTLNLEEKERTHRKFLLLQATYECLETALISYTNALADDSECASAQASARQGAA